MKRTVQTLLVAAFATVITGCGADTMSAAATAGAARAEETRNAKNSIDNVRRQLSTAATAAAKRGS